MRLHQYVAPDAKLNNCYITEGCNIRGEIEHSVIFENVTVEEGAKIKDSIIFPGAVVKKGTYVYKSLIGTKAIIGEGCHIGSNDETANSDHENTRICSDDISVIAPNVKIGNKVKIMCNSMVVTDVSGERTDKNEK